MFFTNKKIKELEAKIDHIETNLLKRISYYETQVSNAVNRMDESVRAVHNMVQTVNYIESTHHDIFFKLKELKDMVDSLKNTQSEMESALELSIKEFILSQTIEPKKTTKTKKIEEVSTPTQSKFSFKRGRPEGLE